MNFNPDPNKHAQEVIFSRKINKINHPQLLFYQKLVKSSFDRKHLGMVLDTKLDFNLHLKSVQSKVNKIIIGLLCKLQNILPRESLIIFHKLFIGPHLNFGDVIHDRGYTSKYRIDSIKCSVNNYGRNT